MHSWETIEDVLTCMSHSEVYERKDGGAHRVETVSDTNSGKIGFIHSSVIDVLYDFGHTFSPVCDCCPSSWAFSV